MPLSERTSGVQLGVAGAMLAGNLIGLASLKYAKASGRADGGSALSWSTKRNAYWAYMASALTARCLLDQRWGINETFSIVQTYLFAFPVALLDFYFSNTQHVSWRVIPGAALWCFCSCSASVAGNAAFGGPGLTRIVDSFGPISLAKEVARFISVMPLIGIFSDVIFSPLHRLEHKPWTYKDNHKVHHEYTNQITSLVLYHGAYLDDFLMPLTTVVGSFLTYWLASLFGWQEQVYSNITWQLAILNTLFSHAHDEKAGGIMLPLPEGLNFAAYHRAHHIHPGKNFGLTVFSDMLWDRILGVDTIFREDAVKEPKKEK